ncbi:hypothetical protein [Kingella potus]|nr:hypothetical protein [Kingella potus]UOO99896.1 hypothetical protein LVJ84_07405 [Kingella potus]
MTIYRYRHPPVTVAFVCFACRIKTTRSKCARVNEPAVLCPQCRRPCDNIGDRRPVPPRRSGQAWQKMERDYRSLQQRILAAYQQWRREARRAALSHWQLAQKLNLPDIVARDEFWLEKLDALPDVPYAAKMPYLRDWLGAAAGNTAWHSHLGQAYPHELQELADKPFNKGRQAQIDERVARHNRLHLHDWFGELVEACTVYHGEHWYDREVHEWVRDLWE